MRKTIQDHLLENRDLLGGHDDYDNLKDVEIDEFLLVRCKSNKEGTQVHPGFWDG
jgi:hypothetical protein